MAHIITLNYGGAAPSMAVFGMLPKGFYDIDNEAIMATIWEHFKQVQHHLSVPYASGRLPWLKHNKPLQKIA